MENYEYNNILDFYTNQYNCYLSTDRRKRIIKLYEVVVEMTGESGLEKFMKLVEHIIIEERLSNKYPYLELYTRIFSIENLN